MASGIALQQKKIIAGSGINLMAGIDTLTISASGNTPARFEFTSADVVLDSDGKTSKVTVATNANIVGVIDETGKQYSLPDEAVVYTTNGAVIDITSVLVKKNVTKATMVGNWYIPFSGTGGSFTAAAASVDVNPPVEFTQLNQTYGRVSVLDETTPLITLVDFVWNLLEVEFYIVSANADVTGNIVLVPVFDGVDQTPITLAVGSVPAKVSFPLSVAGSKLAFRRAYSNAADTLKDGDLTVGAILICQRYLYA